jgi:hypothetical protein
VVDLETSKDRRKVLFLNRKPKTEFYQNERNKYTNVTAAPIFKNMNFIDGKIKKILGLSKSHLFFGDWKDQICNFDLFIITVSRYSLEIAKYIRQRSNKKIIHWYWNTVSTQHVDPDKIRGYDAELCSFDENDCKCYQMNYLSTYYFSTIHLKQNKIVQDIFFVGADKGRLDKLLEWKKIFEDQGLKVNYHITASSELKKIGTYLFQPNILYTEVLVGISKSRAILDYVQAGQTGLTQRPLEAFFHKKKLITNNANIIKYDFYNEGNIFILDRDNVDSLKEFIYSPYIEIDQKIVEKYDFGNWIKQIE